MALGSQAGSQAHPGVQVAGVLSELLPASCLTTGLVGTLQKKRTRLSDGLLFRIRQPSRVLIKMIAVLHPAAAAGSIVSPV